MLTVGRNERTYKNVGYRLAFDSIVTVLFAIFPVRQIAIRTFKNSPWKMQASDTALLSEILARDFSPRNYVTISLVLLKLG